MGRLCIVALLGRQARAGDLVDAVVSGKRGSSCLSVSGQHIDDAGRQTRLLKPASQPQRAQRRLFRHLAGPAPPTTCVTNKSKSRQTPLSALLTTGEALHTQPPAVPHNSGPRGVQHPGRGGAACLDNNAVAAGEGGGQLPGKHHQREVPGYYLPHHSCTPPGPSHSRSHQALTLRVLSFQATCWVAHW